MHTRRFAGIALPILLAAATLAQPSAQESWLEPYREPARRIIAEATDDRLAWERLAELSDTFGHRLSGSESLE
ncbi:MAG: peptidase M28 family protein, partial [Vicinamibacterales bacterium]